MARNKTYDKLLAEMEALHDAKNSDYAHGDNPYANFEFAAEVAGVDVPTVFDVLIGIKQARLQSLRAKASEGGTANYESEADTMLDQAVYTSLKVAWLRDNPTPPLAYPDNTVPTPPSTPITKGWYIDTSGNEWYNRACGNRSYDLACERVSLHAGQHEAGIGHERQRWS